MFLSSFLPSFRSLSSLFSFFLSLGLVYQYPLLNRLPFYSRLWLIASNHLPPSYLTAAPCSSFKMSSPAANIETLDCSTALSVLEKEYERDGLDVRSLLDTSKRGGLT